MKNFFRLPVIIGSLPVTLANGTTADATQVMSDLNWIVNQVNANAADLATVALINANNNFSVVQSGVAATAAANFPIATQVQNQVFNTLSSTLGTNVLTARVAALPLAAYAVGQVFTFVPSQKNTSSATINIDSLGSAVIKSGGQLLVGRELGSGASMVQVASVGAMPVLNLVGNPISFFESLETGIGSAATVGVTSGFGVVPRFYQVVLRNKVSELGFSVGDEVDASSAGNVSLISDALGIYVTFASGGVTPTLFRRDTGAPASITASSWVWVARAWK